MRFPPRKTLFYALSALTLFTFASCSKQRVVLLEPKENDLVEINGCVVSACNFLAITKAKHRLEPDFWTRILLVRFEDNAAGHAYCVWETEGTIYGYDRNSGGFPIPVYTRDPRAIAIVLAQELSKVLKRPLAVKSADFVEPATAENLRLRDQPDGLRHPAARCLRPASEHRPVLRASVATGAAAPRGETALGAFPSRHSDLFPAVSRHHSERVERWSKKPQLP